MRYYYRLVREYGKYGHEYTVYEARQEGNGVQIAANPFVLVGNHPDEIIDTLGHIMKDIKANPPVDKDDCDIFHETLWSDDDDQFIIDEEHDAFDLSELTREALIYGQR